MKREESNMGWQKQFLSSQPSEDSTTSWYVGVTTGTPEDTEEDKDRKRWARVDATLKIRDCRNTVTLDFDVWNHDEIQLDGDEKVTIHDRLDKIDTLIFSLEKFKESLWEAEEIVTEHMNNAPVAQ